MVSGALTLFISNSIQDIFFFCRLDLQLGSELWITINMSTVYYIKW